MMLVLYITQAKAAGFDVDIGGQDLLRDGTVQCHRKARRFRCYTSTSHIAYRTVCVFVCGVLWVEAGVGGGGDGGCDGDGDGVCVRV